MKAATLGLLIIVVPLALLAVSICALVYFEWARVLATIALLTMFPLLSFLLLLFAPRFRRNLRLLREGLGTLRTKGKWGDIGTLEKAASLTVVPLVFGGLIPSVFIAAGLFRLDKSRLIRVAPAITLLWIGYNALLAYLLAGVGRGRPIWSLIVAGLLCFNAMHASLSGLQTGKGGVVKLLDYVEGAFSPATVLAYALAFAASFGCIHYDLWLLDKSAYVGMQGWQDSLYFSVVTMATVGYGDIVPVSHLARWACTIEIIVGFMMLVLALNATMTLWLQRSQSLATSQVLNSDPNAEQQPSPKS